ncbi:hypothetical protein C6502_02765 [Candidatus Poribacteria bacterium]|nr:MAG: hypothetical protein C6502_02765 [Candidatus Poribacteria bacterium]
MAVLTVSVSFSAIAQQNSVRIEAETAAARDANAVSLEAKVAAERDASSDTNRLLWFGAGMGACCIGGGIGGLTGFHVAQLISPIEVKSSEGLGFAPYLVPDISNSGATIIGSCIGFAAGVLVPFIWIGTYEPNLPPKRFIGKSPEYVESYTNAYRAKTRRLRTMSAAAGAATVGGGLGLCLLGSIQ